MEVIRSLVEYTLGTPEYPIWLLAHARGNNRVPTPRERGTQVPRYPQSILYPPNPRLYCTQTSPEHVVHGSFLKYVVPEHFERSCTQVSDAPRFIFPGTPRVLYPGASGVCCTRVPAQQTVPGYLHEVLCPGTPRTYSAQIPPEYFLTIVPPECVFPGHL